ncbi:unnamed protein product [Phyllotreta striolata]|uniref:Uncharacterized protein n=1 Tax=Phyllotreta striolata TaxID=444603 RepID=A0A9N9XM01_PHYSR|nr:unnamed protein product [Phyllotreta striolata]
MIKFTSICFCLYACSSEIFAFPVSASDTKFVLVPISLSNFNSKPRGPLDFIGNWIQSSNFFPVEINVPDTFATVGGTVGGWATNLGGIAQNVGSTFQGLTQNVGSGIQNIAQTITQRLPFLAAIVRPPGASTQRFVLLIPAQGLEGKDKMDFNANSELLEIFP